MALLAIWAQSMSSGALEWSEMVRRGAGRLLALLWPTQKCTWFVLKPRCVKGTWQGLDL